MNTILFCNDTYYHKTPNGNIYVSGVFPYALWQERFLPHCKKLTVIGRNQSDIKKDTPQDKSNGPNVKHVLLDNINTPFKRIFSARAIYNKIKQEVAAADGVIIRGPVEFGMMAAKAARELNKPYAVEMSGCAFDHTWNHGSLIGKLYAPLKYLRARHMVKHANQVIYVTAHFLQKRYPNPNHTTNASNVEIDTPPADILQKRLERIKNHAGTTHLGLIGNFGNNLKGIDVALKAINALKRGGKDVHLHILGKGDPQEWQPFINQHNLQNHVTFHGSLTSGQPVLDWLDRLDFYIQPSRHEGLPRAVIEAMSRGLPCLASNAGGTVELLDLACIHKPGKHQQLNDQLEKIWDDKNWMAEQATKNFNTAQNYTKERLKPKRHAFWKKFTALK